MLRSLEDARDDYRIEERRSSFALSAITGAGKTVMAAAVFEALFYGSETTTSTPTRARSFYGSPTTRT